VWQRVISMVCILCGGVAVRIRYGVSTVVVWQRFSNTESEKYGGLAACYW